jgi:hypothetical protein
MTDLKLIIMVVSQALGAGSLRWRIVPTQVARRDSHGNVAVESRIQSQRMRTSGFLFDRLSGYNVERTGHADR